MVIQLGAGQLQIRGKYLRILFDADSDMVFFNTERNITYCTE